MNLRLANGKVPIRGHGDTPYVLVDFPSKTTFIDLYSRSVRKENILKYWEILNARAKGATLEEAGKPHGIGKERVRQIEAKFLRLLSDKYSRVRSSLMTDSLGSPQPADDNH